MGGIMIQKRLRWRTTGLAIMACLLCGGLLSRVAIAGQESPESPQDMPGTTKVSAESLIELINQQPRTVIIDARITKDREQGYIESSLSLADVDTDCPQLAERIDDLQSPVLFYCNGPKCGRSANAARIALDCGYTQIYWFRGGYEEWRAKNYPAMKR